jgi:phosphoglycerate dehydrogenase-like enzyme
MGLLGIDLEPPPADVLEAFGIQYLGGPDSLDSLLGQSDYVSVHVPLTRRTKHMLDARALAVMRPHGILINGCAAPDWTCSPPNRSHRTARCSNSTTSC